MASTKQSRIIAVEKRFTLSKDIVIREHRVQGLPVLPGVAYLELGRIAAHLHTLQPVLQLKDIVILAQMELGADGTALAQVLLEPQENQPERLHFEIISKPHKEGPRVRHATGTAICGMAPVEEKAVDLPLVRSRCSGRTDANVFYHAFKQKGIDYGPYFQSVSWLEMSENEALARLTLPGPARNDTGYTLHPSLMDGAVQALAGSLLRQVSEGLYLLFSVEEVKILGDPTKSAYAYGLWSGADGIRNRSAEMIRGEVKIVDEEGNVLVSLNGVGLKRIPTEGALKTPSREARRATRSELIEKIDGAAASGSPVCYPEIAVIGMSCRFPGAQNIRSYWQLLRNGVDAISDFPDDRVLPTASKEELRGGYISEVDHFDPLFFGISPAEAELIDPQQRLVLEVVWETLEHAGHAGRALALSRTGVFVGAAAADYGKVVPPCTPHAGPGTELSLVASRVSYVFDLIGPSLVMNTACSSSLVALDMACRSLHLGQCDQAIVAGTNLILTDETTNLFRATGMLAPDGRCKTFDNRADGYVRGEGVGAVLIKSLNKAIADGDYIYAVIKGSAVNHDGHSKVGLTAPNPKSQKKVILSAYEQAGVDASTVTYIEAHGTGTAMGDPIEIEALTQAFREYTDRKQFCSIGTVKTNIGHLEPASGIAGLIKVILCLQHQELPPSLHFNEANPAIAFEESPFRVNTELRRWESSGPRRAGISSFGWGGANAHAVVEEAPPLEAVRNDPERPMHLLTLSAKNQSTLRTLAGRYAKHFSEQPEISLADSCFTANTGRGLFKERLAVVAASTEVLQERLGRFSAGESSITGVWTGTVRPNKRSKLAFMFTGQGSQYVGMGKELYDTQPTFRRVLQRCDEILRGCMEGSLLDHLYPPEGWTSRLGETWLTQPALFALDYALAELWLSWGVRPEAVMGHSVGEYVAACVSGVMSLEDGLKLIAARGRLMGALPMDGAMAAVMASESVVAPRVKDFESELAIAAHNGPELVVLSGKRDALDRVLAKLKDEGIMSQRLAVSHAFHSPLMEPMLEEFAKTLERVQFSSPRFPLVSNLTGKFLEGAEITTNYWLRHIREPVRFHSSIEYLWAKGYRMLLEVGPKPILCGMAKRILAQSDGGSLLPSLSPRGASEQRGREWDDLLSTLARLYAEGVEIDWEGADRDYTRQKLPLPTYPFERRRHWCEEAPADSSAVVSLKSQRLQPLLDEEITSPSIRGGLFQKRFALSQDATVRDHRVQNAAILPGVGYVEMAFAAARRYLNCTSLQMKNLVIMKPLGVGAEGEVLVQVLLEQVNGSDNDLVFRIVSKDEQGSSWNENAMGKIVCSETAEAPKGLDLAAIQARSTQSVTSKQLYPLFKEIGIEYGPYFQSVEWLKADGREVLARLVLPEEARGEAGYVLHPSLTDGALQALAVLLLDEGTVGETYVPFSIDTVTVFDELPEAVYAYGLRMDKARDSSKGPREILRSDVKLVDEQGRVLVTLDGVCLKRARMERSVGSNSVGSNMEEERPKERQSLPVTLNERDVDGWFHAVRWRPLPRSGDAPLEKGTWLIFMDELRVGEKLIEKLEAKGNRCIRVTKGDAYSDRGALTYTVNPRCIEDYQAMARTLSESETVPSGVIHLWTCTPMDRRPESLKDLEDSQYVGVYSLLFLTQALTPHFKKERMTYWLVTNYGQAVDGSDQPWVAPEKATLWGLGKVISKEYSRLACRGIDLETEGVSPESLADLVLSEIEESGDSPDSGIWVAYRAGERLLAGLESIDVSSRIEGSVPLTDGGVYLITGGQGSIGLEVAKFIAGAVKARLVLLNRTPLDPDRNPERADGIRELEALGSEVMPVAADVADLSRMREVVAQVKKRWGGIDGVIHGAGLIRDGLIRTKSLEDFLQVLGPKVQGTWVLEKVLREEKLQFFVLFSSLASVAGNPGQGDYCAANAFLDAFACLPAEKTNGAKRMALGWSLWGEVGMGLSEEVMSELRHTGLNPLPTKEAVFAFGQALRLPGGHYVIVDFGPPPEIVEAGPPKHAVMDTKDSDRVGNGAQLEVSIQDYLVEQIAQVLKLEREHVDVDTNFQELGFDSIMAMKVKRGIEEEVKIELKPVLLFEYPTIRELSEYLVSEHADAFARTISPSAGDNSSVESSSSTELDLQHLPEAGDLWAQPPVESISEPEGSPAEARIEELEASIRDYLIDKVSAVLKLDKEHIDTETNFQELGFDSIMAMKVKRNVEDDVGIELKPVLLFEYPTVGELAQYFSEEHASEFTRLLTSGRRMIASANPAVGKGNGNATSSEESVPPAPVSETVALAEWETGEI